MKNILDSYKEVYDQHDVFYDENIMFLSWYAKKIIEKMRKNNFKSLISLGIGHKVVSKTTIDKLEQFLEKYIIIEGSKEIVDDYKKLVSLPKNVQVLNMFFEDFDTDEKFDAIEMGFVLEHVNDPLYLLNKYSGFLNSNGIIFIAVPNAKSLHRRIGFEAKAIDNLYYLSEYDLRQGH
ncbi:MAG: class I SAM-dependent methyltransferase, partial [Gammaproteobacteria bacterium]|nr:class I SAM-dependent methyltransferase [Gammaproteobacteria bacterium]